MIFDITSIADAENFEQERVVIKASAEGNIGRFAVFCANRSTTDSALALSGDVPNTYWFSDRDVKAGDFIVLYTKAGTRSAKTTESGSTSYFFYWGCKAAIWTPKTRAVLVDIAGYRYQLDR